MFLNARRSVTELELDLTGSWRIGHFADLDRELAAVELAGVHRMALSTARLEALDLSATWRLREFLDQARAAGIEISFRDPPPDQLRLVDATLVPTPAPVGAPHPTEFLFEEPVEAIGRGVIGRWQEIVSGLAFIGRLSVTLVRALTSRGRLRPTSIARHIYDTGITALPVIALIAFLISVILAYLGAQQLQRFGAEILVVDLVTIGVLRELGVLLTAIVIAGRSGSAFAAELGSMQLNEEVDALYATGVDPLEALVLPRVLGLTIALPLLTVVADAIGLTGAGLLCRVLLGIPLPQYLARVNESIASTTFWVGILKAPVFAILISLAGTYRGLQVRDSSRELGRLTTVAVVQSIFLVILADAVFAVLFMELGI